MGWLTVHWFRSTCYHVLTVIGHFFGAEEQDNRFGRNIARTILQYYRFINVLPLPMVPEIRSKSKSRPKTNVTRNKKRTYEVQIRPKTTRNYAPISYNDLSIYYESVSSDEACSPIRQSFVIGRKSAQPKVSSDHYSMMSIKSSKFDKLTFTEPDQRTNKTGSSSAHMPPFEEESKHYLSIIDFNQLTRTSIDKAVANLKRN
uniref:Uncharacterized protein n=1 Tax=Megaselia scalaris TaxID=36166 RepID=T1H1K1_MEGSC